MKQLLLPILALLFLVACEKEVAINLHESFESNTISARGDNIDVCHNGHIININVNAIAAHQTHGDAVDMDGDGFFDIENECGLPVDCDDSNAELTDNCICIEGEVEIDFNGPLYVAPADEFTHTENFWQAAIDACNALDTDGCDWSLPTKDELNAIYEARNTIGGFHPSGFYYSSTESSVDRVWIQRFNTGEQYAIFKNNVGSTSCRCVRR